MAKQRIAFLLAAVLLASLRASASASIRPGATSIRATEAEADLFVTQTGPDVIDPVVQDVSYDVFVGNSGPANAGSMSFTYQLFNDPDARMTFLSLTQTSGPEFTCTTPAVDATGTISCSASDLPAGGSAAFTVTGRAYPGRHHLTFAYLPFYNTATVTPGGAADPNQANNSSTFRTSVRQRIDVSLSKVVSPTRAAAGEQVTYTLKAAADVSFADAPPQTEDVVITDTLPPGLTFVTSTPSRGTCSGTTTVRCEIGVLSQDYYSPVHTATVTIVVMVNGAFGSTIHNTATVTHAEYDPDPANNTATADLEVSPFVDVSITNEASPPEVPPAAPVTYALTVKNVPSAFGGTPATGVTVTDVLSAGLAFISASPSQGTCGEAEGTIICNLETLGAGASATIAIVVEANVIGAYENTAAVSFDGADLDVNPANNTAKSVFAVLPCLPMQILRQPEQQTVAHPQQVTLSFDYLSRWPAAIQWFEGSAPDTSSPVTGGNALTLSVFVSRSQDFWARVTDICGSADTSTAHVAVQPPGRRRAARH